MIAVGIVILAAGAIGSLVCWIMVLIKMFKNEKPLIGILGILCSLWAFIWGWMKSGSLGLKKVMIIWCVCVGLTVVGNIMWGTAMAAKLQSGDIQMPESVPAPESVTAPESVPTPAP